MGKYLDKAGLQLVFSKIKQYITDETGKYVTLSQYNDDDEIRAAADVDLDERLQVFEASTYALQDHTHTVDAALSSTSTNPVQNKVINSALAGKAASSHTSVKANDTTYGHVVVDDELNASSTNPVQNKVINTALAGKAASSHTSVKANDTTYGHVIVDDELSASSTNPVQNKVINTALAGKQATITGGATTIVSNNLASSYALISNSSGKVAVSNVTSTELNYLDGVTSSVQTQLNNKQATITGGATTIVSNNLASSYALISNSSGKVAVSNVTSTELNYLDGVTGSVQTQLNNKQAKGEYTTTSGTVAKDHIAVFNAATSTSGAATVIKDSGFTIGTSVPANAVFTDTNTKVSQVSTNTNAKYPLLFKNSSSNDAETTSVRYDSDGLTNSYYNPGTNTLYVTYAYTTSLYQSGKKVSVEGHTHDYQAPLTFDSVPTNGSNNPVKSDGIYDALANKVNSSDIGNAKIFAGTCGTAAATTAKVVTCASFTSSDLVKGVVIIVTFTYTNSGAVDSITMNVNNTGAKPIKKIKRNSMANLDHTGELYANQTYIFQYDGTNWVCITNDWYPTSMSVDGGITGTSTTVCSISPKTLNDILNAKTVTSISMNGNTLTKTDEGLVDLGTVLTSHQSLKTINNNTITGSGDITIATPGTLNTNNTAAQTASSSEALSGTIKLHKIAKTGTYSDLIGTPTIPTESTVSGWGFTKNAGTVTSVKINGTAKNPSSGVVDLGTVITTETSLSKGTTSGSGNAVTDISVSGHQITLTKGTTFLTSHQSIKTINNNTITGTGNVTIATPGTLKTDATTTQTASSSEALSGTITLHKISKTGSYDDLLDKPTIPAAAGAGAFKIQANSSTAVSTGFTANSGSDTTAIKFVDGGGITVTAAQGTPATVTLGVSSSNKLLTTTEYNTLNGKVSANDKAVKISGAGTTVSAFTLNSSADRTISFAGQTAGSNASGTSSDYASITTTAGGSSNSATLTITTNATSDSYMPFGDEDDALSAESVVAALASGGLFDVDDVEMNIYGEPDEENSYLYFVNPGTSNVQINLFHNQSAASLTTANNVLPVISYSFNKTTWTNMAAPTNGQNKTITGPTLTPGQKVYFKGTNARYSLYGLSGNTPTSTYAINSFRPTGPVYCGGNVMSMIYGDNFRGKKDIKTTFAFSRLFADNGANLLSAPILPATMLSQWCYYAMFTDDSALKNPPVLPARFVPIGAYSRMFYGCSNLKAAPDLPATRIGVRSYYEMFQGCTSLTGNPTIYAMLANNGSFAYMFCNCSSLNNITIRTTNMSNGNATNLWPCTYMLYGTAPNGVLSYIDGSNIYTQYSTNTGVKTLVPSTWTFEKFSYSFTDGRVCVN